MKRLLAVVVLALFLTGCSDDGLDRAMQLRSRLQSSKGCTFQTVVTADYGDIVYGFTMDCQTDAAGNLSFTVLEPETIRGITGSICEVGGELTFDDQVLAFELLADGQLSPVSAPWILIRTLRSGYLSACTDTEDGLLLVIDDSYADDALQLNIWLDDQGTPQEGEIFWDGRRIVTTKVQSFTYL